jgi:transposase InsO family protein
VIVGDITQYSVNGKDYFLSVLMDLCNREIIGKAISDRNDTELVLATLEDVVKTRGKKNLKGCIHHTDSDVRYCSKEYTKVKNENINV